MEVFVIGIILGIVVVIGAVVFTIREQTQINQQVANAPYTPEVKLPYGSGQVCISQTDRKVMIISSRDIKTISFDDILSVEMFVDGTSTYGRSVGKTVGAAMIGGVVGAMLVGQKEKKSYSDLHLNIGTRQIGSSTITIPLVSFEQEDITIEREWAVNIVNALKAIIDDNDRRFQAELAAAQAVAVAQAVQTASPTVQPPSQIEEQTQSSVSVADEIRKCAALLEDGIITEAEFNDMKSALLKGNK